jgi:hypothetical protein
MIIYNKKPKKYKQKPFTKKIQQHETEVLITFQEKDNKTKFKKINQIPAKILKAPKGTKKILISYVYGNSKKTNERLAEKYELDGYDYRYRNFMSAPDFNFNGSNIRSVILNEAEIGEDSLNENYSEDENLNELETANIEPFPLRKISIKYYK